MAHRKREAPRMAPFTSFGAEQRGALSARADLDSHGSIPHTWKIAQVHQQVRQVLRSQHGPTQTPFGELLTHGRTMVHIALERAIGWPIGSRCETGLAAGNLATVNP